MDFPRFVFYVPGPRQHQGFTYDHYLVEDQEEYKLALEEGFSETVADARFVAESRTAPKADPVKKSKKE